MTTYPRLKLIALAALLLLTALWHPAARAGDEFTLRLKNDEGLIRTHYVSAHAVRTVSAYPVETDVIYRLDEGKIIQVDNKNKTYIELTLAELQRRGAGSGSPATAATLFAPPSINKEGAGDTILGYSTERYSIKSPLVQSESWVTTALDWPPAYRELFLATAPGPLKASVGSMHSIRGVALKTVGKMSLPTIPGMNTTAYELNEVAVSVDKGPIPSEKFTPPAGYRKVSPQ